MMEERNKGGQEGGVRRGSGGGRIKGIKIMKEG